MTPDKEKMNEDSTALIGIYRCWSWDQWSEINHADPEMRCQDDGPRFHAAVLMGTRGGDAPAAADALASVDEAVDTFMGHAERVSTHTVSYSHLREMARDCSCDLQSESVEIGEAFEIIWEGQHLEDAPTFEAR